MPVRASIDSAKKNWTSTSGDEVHDAQQRGKNLISLPGVIGGATVVVPLYLTASYSRSPV